MHREGRKGELLPIGSISFASPQPISRLKRGARRQNSAGQLLQMRWKDLAPFIAKNSSDVCRYVLEIGFQVLFQFLPTPIAVFPCDYVLRVGKPCAERSSFAI